MTPIWGIDLGGTKIECAVIESLENRNVLLRKRLPTEQVPQPPGHQTGRGADGEQPHTANGTDL